MATEHEATEYKEVALPQGTIRYRDVGPESGDVVLFVHGALVDGDLWRDVAPPLAEKCRCIVPDLPLGGHTEPMHAEADLSPPGIAVLLGDFLDALGLQSVTLVGNDTGGAICQIFLAEHPERVSQLVLTNCDALRNFFPLLVRPLQYGARLPGVVFAVTQSMRLRAVRRLVMASVAKRPVSADRVERWLLAAVRDPEIRRDLRKLLAGASPTQTLDAAATFPEFEKPVLLAWAPDDRLLFPLKYATRLAELFPNARLELIEDARAFVSIDQPDRLAQLIAAFVEETSGGDRLLRDGSSPVARTRS